MSGLKRLRDAVVGMTRLVENRPDDVGLLAAARPILETLVAQDDWLPASYAEPDPQRYRQSLLHCDPLERFSVVSFVWGPGQATPVHDHRAWGLIGVLRGAEVETPWIRRPDGSLQPLSPARLEAGQVTILSSAAGDIHHVQNAFADRTSISIHIYGTNIGSQLRATFDPTTGKERRFISGYTNSALPNLWDSERAG
jgi:predicted metal-dependent enzyme (double-stranded beta helix superfamily)